MNSTNTARTNLEGALAPALTFFDETLAVDHERNAEHLDWLATHGVRGVLVLGSTAETGALTHAEKRRILALAAERKTNLSRVACLAGTALGEVLELAAVAREHDYDAVLVAPPHHPRTARPEGVALFLRAVAERVGLPVLGYCFPAQFGHGLDVLAKGLGSLPNFVGIKESSGAISATAFRERFPDKVFLPGGDDRILGSLEEGARGSITAATNVVPEFAVAVHESFARGDHEGARSFQERLSGIRSLFSFGDPQAVAKYLLTRRGRGTRHVRPPLLGLDAAAEAAIEERLASLEPHYSEAPDLSS